MFKLNDKYGDYFPKTATFVYMNAVLKNYASTLLLLAGVVAGGVCGAVFGPAASVVKPVGDIFLNLLFTIVVPLVFFSIATSICKLRASGKVGKVITATLLVFLVMSIIASFIAWLGCLVINPIGGIDGSALLESLPAREGASVSTGDAIVNALTVPDFAMLFTRAHLLPLIIFAAFVGAGTSLAGEKGKPFAAFLESGTEVIMKVMDILMYAAPIGLGCYFADTVATLGAQIFGGYLRVFLLFCALSAVIFFVVNPLYILLTAGKDALKAFWKHIIPPCLTAIATCSSSAVMPGNIEAAKRIGVSPAIADAVIPLGTNLHKDGSVMGGVIKAAFLILLFNGGGLASPGAALTVIGIAIVSSIVMGAVANGGATGEILTCTMLGLDPSVAAIIIIIGTIIDVPATLINSSSNVVSAIVVDKFTE